MAEYTYKDVIIDPTSNEARDCIDKEVYFNDSPNACLYYANTGNNAQCGILRETKIDSFCPFVVEKNGSRHWGCIIPKKEESKPDPKYVPFKNSGEFVSEFESNTPIIYVYGLWIYEKIGKFDEKVPRLVTEMWGDGLIIGSDTHTTKWKDLLEKFVFENNEPCGRKV